MSSPDFDKKLRWLPWCLYPIGALLLLAPVWFSQRMFFYRDFWQLYYPGLKWAAITVKNGNLPLWNPYIACGYPAFAAMTCAYAYPPVLLLLLPWFDIGLKLYIFCHLIWAGWGSYRLCRELRCSPVAAGIGGMIFMAGGPVVSGINNICYLLSPAWLPWTLWCYLRLLATRRPRWLIATAVTLALMALAGDSQSCYHAGILLLLLTISQWREQGWRQTAGNLLALFAAIVVAVALAAVQLLPTAELAANCERLAGVQNRHAFLFSFYGKYLWRLVVPFIYGNPTHIWHGPGAYTTMPFLSSIYLGLATIPLALTGLFRASRLRWRYTWGISAVLFLLTSLAIELPLYRFFRQWLPLWSSFRYAEKLLLPLALMLAVLAAGGLDYWARLAGKNRWRYLVAAALLLPGLVGAAYYQFPVSNTGPLWFCLATIVALAFMGSGRWPWLGPIALCLVLSADLTYHNRQVLPTIESQFYRQKCPPLLRPFAGQNRYRIALFTRVVQATRFGLPERRITRLSRRWGLANLPMLHRVPKDLGAVQVFISPYSLLRWRATQTPKLFPRFSVKRLIWGFPNRKQVQAHHYPLRYQDWPQARPRASLVHRSILVADRQEAIRQMLKADLDTVVVCRQDGPLPPLPADTGKSSGQDHVNIVAETSPNMVVIETVTRRPAYLLLTDNYYPGWQALIDGRAVPIYRAEVAFRLISLPVGKHTVVFRYRPLSLQLGAVISLLALVLIAVVVSVDYCHYRGDHTVDAAAAHR